MDYYFPGIIPSCHILKHSEDGSDFMVDSGRNALRLLLRSFNLPKGAKVAVPAFVCDAVRQAVTLENLTPVFLDLKSDFTFWTDYNPQIIKQEAIRAIILVHLYGFLHPDTEVISSFCRENKIRLIHDAAPSFGIDENLLGGADGIVYSFGVGKSSTACGGAWVKGLSKDYYHQQVMRPSLYSLRHLQSRLLLKSRIYGYRFSFWERVLKSIAPRFNPRDNRIFALGEFEKNAAKYAMGLVKDLSQARKQRHQLITDKIKNHPFLSLAYDDKEGLYFKSVLLVKKEKISDFKEYLKHNHVPYFCLYDSINSCAVSFGSLRTFLENAPRFIEISCEASIPLNEIERVANILKEYQ